MDQPEHKIEYHANGQVRCESWYVNGKRHRLDGPAVIQYNANGHEASEAWLVNGAYQRLDGPAVIEYDDNGQIIGQEFWVRGQVDCAKLGQFVCEPERWKTLLLKIPVEFGIDYVVDLGLIDWWLEYRPQDREYLNET